ncbi:MAG: Do family serine endopeptidase [Pseudomonadota bacterium]
MLTKTPRALALAAALALSPAAAAPLWAQSAPIAETLPSFSSLVKAARPAVVTVMTARPGAQVARTPRMPDGMDEFFRRFAPDNRRFGVPETRPAPRQQGVGSGFILSDDGIIVTNNHVVEGAAEITVRLEDGREFEAELIGRDDKVDLAVLRIEASDLPTLAWGTSDAVEVGDWAVAIGNPFGLGGTVTAGIVSARGRDLRSGPYDDYLQVDAAINRGNSGGPLLDLAGDVIGVNTMIFSPSGGNVGLGFAIPAAQASAIVADLLDDGTVERGWIGVRIQPVSAEIAESLGLNEASGALVAEVTDQSPAAAAGLRAGDVILSFAGSEIAEIRDLTRTVADSAIGEGVDLEIWRSGEIETLRIAPGLMEAAMTAPVEPALETTALGLGVRPVTSEERSSLGVAGGLLIERVDPDGAAAAAGLGSGDVLLSANQAPLQTAGDLAGMVATADRLGRDAILLQVLQRGQMRFLTVDLTPS